jgi:hypothetical protein
MTSENHQTRHYRSAQNLSKLERVGDSGLSGFNPKIKS